MFVRIESKSKTLFGNREINLLPSVKWSDFFFVKLLLIVSKYFKWIYSYGIFYSLRIVFMRKMLKYFSVVVVVVRYMATI